MGKYRSLSILDSMYEEVRELIFQQHWMGYRSVNEFVRDAVRQLLEKKKLELSSQERFRKLQEQDAF